MASPNNPAISFLIPYRWFKEDKEFLGENLKRGITKSVGKENVDGLDGIVAYRILLVYFYKEPIDIPITKTQMQKLLKKVFVNGKCLSVGVQFKQNNSFGLPTVDFQIFF